MYSFKYLTFQPYSLVDEHTTTYENPFKFSAKELDDITGLYDHGARSRNPMSTLWYGVDPLWEKYVDCSPYLYCGANPIKYNDPNGEVQTDSEGNVIFTEDKTQAPIVNPETMTIYSTKHEKYVAQATYQPGYIYTDDGKPVEALKLISITLTDKDGNKQELLGNKKLQKSLGSTGGDFVADRIINAAKANCHGLAYAKGQVWVNDDQISKIINSEWHQIPFSEQQEGDVITIYAFDGNDYEKGVETPLWDCPLHSITNSDEYGAPYTYKGKTRGSYIYYNKYYNEASGTLKNNPKRAYRRNGGTR